MNELLVWWVMWVNSNYDVLIMTFTLLVVGGLMLDVIKLNKRIEAVAKKADWYVEYLKSIRAESDQIKVNVRFANDIAELQKRLKEVKTKRKSIRK